MSAYTLTSLQQRALIVLRTLVAWHFLYEGYVKLWWPSWSRAGTPLPHWSSAGYLRAATGPFAAAFQRLAESSWLGPIDTIVAVSLVLVGLSLMLGLFTQAGCTGALVLLSLFYAAAIPTAGVHQAGTEGAYLLVNKTLIEASAVLLLLAFKTGRIAGLDTLRTQREANR